MGARLRSPRAPEAGAARSGQLRLPSALCRCRDASLQPCWSWRGYNCLDLPSAGASAPPLRVLRHIVPRSASCQLSARCGAHGMVHASDRTVDKLVDNSQVGWYLPDTTVWSIWWMSRPRPRMARLLLSHRTQLRSKRRSKLTSSRFAASLYAPNTCTGLYAAASCHPCQTGMIVQRGSDSHGSLYL